MATVSGRFGSAPLKHSPKSLSDRKQLRKDRITAAIVFLLIAAVMALVIWLASLGNGGVEHIDYWPMMP